MRLGMDFLKAWYPRKTAKVFISDPAPKNHQIVAEKAGFECETYQMSTILEDILKADEESIFVLQVCGNDPLGNDPNQLEWEQILDAMKMRNHFVAFDLSY